MFNYCIILLFTNLIIMPTIECIFTYVFYLSSNLLKVIFDVVSKIIELKV